jgi:hypothetical protein
VNRLLHYHDILLQKKTAKVLSIGQHVIVLKGLCGNNHFMDVKEAPAYPPFSVDSLECDNYEQLLKL